MIPKEIQEILTDLNTRGEKAKAELEKFIAEAEQQKSQSNTEDLSQLFDNLIKNLRIKREIERLQQGLMKDLQITQIIMSMVAMNATIEEIKRFYETYREGI